MFLSTLKKIENRTISHTNGKPVDSCKNDKLLLSEN